jgi:hypothetical protein
MEACDRCPVSGTIRHRSNDQLVDRVFDVMQVPSDHAVPRLEVDRVENLSDLKLLHSLAVPE